MGRPDNSRPHALDVFPHRLPSLPHHTTPQLRGTLGENSSEDECTHRLHRGYSPPGPPTYFLTESTYRTAQGPSTATTGGSEALEASYPTLQRSMTELYPIPINMLFSFPLLTYPPNLFRPDCCVQRFGASQNLLADPPPHHSAVFWCKAGLADGRLARRGGDSDDRTGAGGGRHDGGNDGTLRTPRRPRDGRPPRRRRRRRNTHTRSHCPPCFPHRTESRIRRYRPILSATTPDGRGNDRVSPTRPYRPCARPPSSPRRLVASLPRRPDADRTPTGRQPDVDRMDLGPSDGHFALPRRSPRKSFACGAPWPAGGVRPPARPLPTGAAVAVLRPSLEGTLPRYARA